MTIPFSVPDVKPLYFDTSQIDRDGFQKRLRLLLETLHNRETRNIEVQKMKRDEALRLDQAAAGEQLAQMVRGMDTVPGMSIPTAGPMGGMGPTVQTKPVEGPLAQSFQPRPGTTVNFEAFKTGQNTISQYLNDRNERMKAKAPTKPEVQELTDANGFALSWDKASGTAKHIVGPNGLPVRMRVPNEEVKEDKWQLTGYEQNGVPIEYNGRTGEMRPVRAPDNLFKMGPVTESENRFAMLYTESAEAWKTLKATGYKAIPKDLVGFVASARKAVGEDGAFESFLTSSQVFDEETKQAIMAYAVIGMNNIYGKSGAAITVKEMQGILARLPSDLDSPTTKAAKLRFFRRGVESQFRSGYNALRRGEVEAQVPFQKPYEIFADEPGVDPATQRPWSKENPYMNPSQPTPGGPPPLLRRPQ